MVGGRSPYANLSQGLLIFLLQVATMGGRMRVPMTAYPPISCLDGSSACAMVSHCHVMLEAIPRICNMTNRQCTPKDRLQCRAVQKWLQLTSFFQGCHCRVALADRAQCMMIRRSIYHERCSHKNAGPNDRADYYDTTPSMTNHHGPSPYVQSRMRLMNTDNDHVVGHVGPPHDPHLEDDINLEDEDGEFDDEDQEEVDRLAAEGKISCIGIRKRCLLENDCSQTLTDFRRTCRENKKTAQCVTTERDACFAAIQGLRKQSDIFDCHCEQVKKYRTRKKCDRIQYRLANNTCVVEIPYLIHTSSSRVSSYSDLLTIISSPFSQPPNSDGQFDPWRDTNYKAKVSTCVPAFQQCNQDPNCRLRMAEFLNLCSWDRKENKCNRNYCLATIRKFYLLVRPQFSHSLLYCQCAHGDYKCEAVRQAVYPTCSLLEIPSPSCLDIIERCEADPDCRDRWKAYEKFCSYDKISGGCAEGPSRCRAALLGIMGTILTTNCTCNLYDPDDNARCQKARRRLQHNNVCKDMAYDDYNANNVIVLTTPANLHYWQDTISKVPSRTAVTARQHRQDCLRNLAHKLPSYMAVPTAIRMYHNDSECSDLCQCLENGTLHCKRLPCSPTLSCREKSNVYAHGSGFVRADRGQCRCIKAEVVCARPESIRQKQRTGLFLHVGYSIADRYLIEGNSDVKFDPIKTATKLGTLLNGDAAEQFCRLSLYYQEDGNLLFEIKLSRHTSDSGVAEVCETPTKTLSYMINARHSTIVTDAELSILKVAEMEMVQRLNRPLRSNIASSSLILQAHFSSQRIPLTLPTYLLVLHLLSTYL